jgi:hypothetical protein
LKAFERPRKETVFITTAGSMRTARPSIGQTSIARRRHPANTAM